MSIETAINTLSGRFGDRLSRAAAVREAHGRDEAHHAPAPPDAVLFVESTADVQAAVGLCAEHGCPIVPYGAGSSLEGQLIAVRGGLSLDMTRMNRVLAINTEDLNAVVQPGVTRRQLNEDLRDTGLFFAVDPGADASLGGMAATRASGTNAVRYGTMRETVLALEAVLADGSVVRTGSGARKSSTGYDLTHLLVGSEGTLGVITELTVRLHGQPEAIVAAVCGFESIEGATEATILAIQCGLPVARIELLDEVQMRAVNAYSKLSYPERPTLFLEFHGTEAGAAEQAERFAEIAADCGGSGYDHARKAEDRNRLWRARHDAYYAARSLRPGAEGFVTDACVPISALAEAVRAAKADIAESGLIAPVVGHVGDGNFHLCMLIDPADEAEMATARRLSARIAERALAAGGTVSGEHGVGLGKLRYMQAEHGAALGMMRAIKRALDPQDILNPGKLVPMN